MTTHYQNIPASNSMENKCTIYWHLTSSGNVFLTYFLNSVVINDAALVVKQRDNQNSEKSGEKSTENQLFDILITFF